MGKRAAGGLTSLPSATGGIARLACHQLRKGGKNPKPVILEAGLTLAEVEDRTCRLKAEAQVKILDLAAAELNDDHLGFHLARDYDLGEIGLVYYVMASSERLLDALRNAERYCAVNNEGVRLSVSANRSAVALGLEYLNVDRGGDRHHMEFWVMTLVRVVRAITGGRLDPKLIRLRHRGPQMPADVRAQLRCEIKYAADRDEISFAAEHGTLPVVGADAYLNKLLVDYANEALGRRVLRNSVRSEVEGQIAQLLPNGKANVAEVARRLGMSRRTLARALADEETSFTLVLRDLRQALAERYLREKHLPVSEIAWLLGYREVSSFSHAFVGWTQQTPREFRTAGAAA